MRVLLILSVTILITGCTTEVEQMKLTSPEFEDGGNIPDKFTCKGDDANMELDITETPEGTQTLALIMDDPDAPGSVWDHWVMFNIPVTSKIEENTAPGTQGKNSWGESKYGGPCPPSGTHHYIFKLYALDTTLELDENADKKTVETAMKGHILAQTKLTGLYSKT